MLVVIFLSKVTKNFLQNLSKQTQSCAVGELEVYPDYILDNAHKISITYVLFCLLIEYAEARVMHHILAAPNQIVVFGATKMRRLTQLSMAGCDLGRPK